MKVKDLIEELQKLDPELFIQPVVDVIGEAEVIKVHIRVGPKNPGNPRFLITEKEIEI